MNLPTTIVSSVITNNLPQIDGTSNILETHIDDLGNQYQFSYEAPAGYDVEARLAQRAQDLINQFAMAIANGNN